MLSSILETTFQCCSCELSKLKQLKEEPFDDSNTSPSFHLSFIMHLDIEGSIFHCQGGGKLHQTEGTKRASLVKQRKQLCQCKVSAENIRFSFRLQ